MRLRIDWEVVLRAAALALAVAVPTIVLGSTVARDSNLIVLLYFVFLGGQVAAGWHAGRHRLDAPLVHGALASLTAVAVLAVVIVVARAIAGKPGADPFDLAFHAFMASSTGIFGALIATRASKPPPPAHRGTGPVPPTAAAPPAPTPAVPSPVPAPPAAAPAVPAADPATPATTPPPQAADPAMPAAAPADPPPQAADPAMPAATPPPQAADPAMPAADPPPQATAPAPTPSHPTAVARPAPAADTVSSSPDPTAPAPAPAPTGGPPTADGDEPVEPSSPASS